VAGDLGGIFTVTNIQHNPRAMKKRVLLLFTCLFQVGFLSAQEIMDVDAFRESFNGYEDEMRVVVISDPSCGGCMYMVAEQLMPIFNDPKGCGLSEEIKYFFIWTNVLGADFSHAETHATTYDDERFLHYWDEFQLLGDLYMNTLEFVDPSGEEEAYTAWHTVMCYEPGETWESEDADPPMPNFWQHKLGDSYEAPMDLYFLEETFEIGFNEMACALSIDQLILNDHVAIYPNPANSYINIEFSEQMEGTSLVIYDSKGAVIENTYLSSGTRRLAIDRLEEGMYFCRFIGSDQVFGTKKITILR
jgi:hypothetical protein